MAVCGRNDCEGGLYCRFGARVSMMPSRAMRTKRKSTVWSIAFSNEPRSPSRSARRFLTTSISRTESGSALRFSWKRMFLSTVTKEQTRQPRPPPAPCHSQGLASQDRGREGLRVSQRSASRECPRSCPAESSQLAQSAEHSTSRKIQHRDRLFTRDIRESDKKLFKCFASGKMVKECLDRNTCSLETRFPMHASGIHRNVPAERRVLGDQLAALTFAGCVEGGHARPVFSTGSLMCEL